MSRRPPSDRVESAATPTPAVTNLASARFECVYPSCGGLCCMNGHPAIEPAEEELLRANVDKFVDRLRPPARAQIAAHGFLTKDPNGGRPTLAVSRGWCVFFHDGCVLQKVGAEEGDEYRYKPWRCALFPLKRHERSGDWFVRQRGIEGERWSSLFCLNPAESEKKAGETLRREVAHLERLVAEGRLPAPWSDPSGGAKSDSDRPA